MDSDDSSLSSVEEECTKGNSNEIQKPKLDRDSNHLPKTIQSNDDQSTIIPRGAGRKVNKKGPKELKDRWPVCNIGQGFAGNISSMDDNNSLETSQSMVSFTSTDAICGSSSSEDISDLEPSISEFPSTVGGESDTPSATSSSGIDSKNEFQITTEVIKTADRSSHQEDSKSSKLPEMCNILDAADVPSLTMETLSSQYKSTESQSKMCFYSTINSGKHLGTEELPPNRNSIADSPFSGKGPSNIINASKTQTSECTASGGSYDNDCSLQNNCMQEDKSVRKKVETSKGHRKKVKPSTSSETKSIPSTSSATSTGDGSSHQEDSKSLKIPETCSRTDAIDVPLLPMEIPSSYCKSKESQSKTCLSSSLPSDKPLDIKDTESPFPGKASCNIISEGKTSQISEFSSFSDFYDNDFSTQKYCQKEDKSVRRKVKTLDAGNRRKVRPSTSPQTSSLPPPPLAPSTSNAIKNVGRTLRDLSNSIEQISDQEVAWGDMYSTYGGSSGVRYFTPNSLIRDILSVSNRRENYDTAPGLDIRNLSEEVNYFFQKNRVDADRNLSYEENILRIITSKYFSDEFTRTHGLLSTEQLTEEDQKNLEHCTLPDLGKVSSKGASSSSRHSELIKPFGVDEKSYRRELFNRYKNKNIVPYKCYERNRIASHTDYLPPNRAFSENTADNMNWSSSKDRKMSSYGDGWFIASPQTHSREPKKTLNVVSSSKDGKMSLNDDLIVESSPTHPSESEDSSDVVSSRKEKNMPMSDESNSTIESSETRSRESKETSNVVSESNSNALISIEGASEACDEKTTSLARKVDKRE